MSSVAIVVVAVVLVAAIAVPLSVVASRGRPDLWSKELALIDGTTGLANRRCLERDMQACVADRQPSAAVMVIDIDDFQSLSLLHGPTRSDRILFAISSSLSKKVRAKDVVYRYGDDEFCVILRGAAEKEALRVAERIRASTARLVLPVEGVATVSVGVAVGQGIDVAKTLALAAAAMRDGRVAGPDRVTLAAAR
jgi:diguanylate cyclase (GGDEF)-like protein